MITFVVHLRALDYSTWKAVFDANEGLRRGHGEIEHRIYRPPDDPNRIVVHNDFETVEAAMAFRDDPALHEAIRSAGVDGEAGFGVLELTERVVYTDEAGEEPPVTLVVHHRVESAARWKPVFDEHESARRQHGALEQRVYQDPDDPERIVVHVDFPSVRHGQGLAGDPSLEQAMERAGVVGEPWLGFVTLAERKTYAAAAV